MPDIEKYVERVDDFFTVEGLKNNWAVLSVAAIVFFAVWLRYRPAEGMKYLQALDPYMIYRMSQHVALDGNLPQLDFLRYTPYNVPTYLLNQGDIVFPAILYWAGPFLFFQNFMGWAQFYPALMGGVGVLFAYFFGKEVWNRVAGVSSAFFLATIAGAMHRTSAGFFEKEPIGTALMMISLYFFVRAWKRMDWKSGMVSGLALGFFTISWGGAKMVWLLYPLTVGTVMLLDEDIRSLVTAYTPTVIIGAGVAVALNPASYWFTDSLFLANVGLLGLLWSRYLVEEFEILDNEHLGYYVPTVSVVGAVALALSPLYSDFLATRVMSIYVKATQSGGAVIAGTVAENTPAGLGQIVSQLGSSMAMRVNPVLGLLANVVGTWPLAFLGIAFLGTSVMLMVLRKYGVIGETIEGEDYFKAFGVFYMVWVLAFALFFKDSVLVAVLPATLAAVGGFGLFYTFAEFDTREIEFKWYYMLPFLWTVTNVIGAVAKSRLVFLATFSVAVSAGYMFSLVVRRVNTIDYSSFLEDGSSNMARVAALAGVVILVFSVSAASGYGATQGLGGSPNSAWMQNLNYMQQETPRDSTILSWWDYGYWFESIGRRAAVADGGNMGHYSSKKFGKVNYPIADYFTSSNPGNYTWLLKKHSVDYIVLDSTMIGKYSAVSQIAHRDNSQFNSMLTLTTSGNLRNSISQNNGQMVGEFSGRGFKVYAPLNSTNDSIGFGGAPVLETGRGRAKIGCALTEEGYIDFNVSGSTNPYCVAEHPYRSFERGLTFNQRSGIVLVPKEIMKSTLVRLYLMDGYGIDYVEKVPRASNGYVKMWKVKDLR
ncbi:MAG: STT3 domain-containing protein [Candidatus Nanohaloarchaea archaeon]